jgi:hypothetical protein
MKQWLRQRMSTVAVVSAAAVVLLLPGGARGATVVNGNFETGNLSSWTVVNSGSASGNWFAYSGTTSPVSAFTVAAPPQGTFAATTDQTGPGSHILYRDIALEAGATHTLTFTLYYANRAAAFSTPASLSESVVPNQQYRVDLVKPSAPITSVAASDVLANLFQTKVGDPLILAPKAITADLTPYAGQTIRLRFAEVDNQSFFHAAVDDVKVVSVLPQTITFGTLAAKTFGDADFAVSATASSGLPVSFAASGNCTVSGSTVHLTGAGSCTIKASQSGNSGYQPAPDVSQTFAIAKAAQTIAFAALGGKTFGDADFAASATASSGLPVSFSASGSCTVSGATVHIASAGSCTMTASQAGDANYSAAPAVSQTFAIAMASQTISFSPLAGKTFGDPDFAVSATASSGLAVSFAASGNCTVSAANVHLTGAGSCTVTAAQPGDANYSAAPAVSQTFSIAPKAPLKPPTTCKVPNVVGKRLAAAKQAITRSHCRTGKVGYAYSRKSKKGIVISQSRRLGRVLPVKSKIDLVVSRGRKH